MPIERLQAFYQKYYQPDNAMLVVAGKFDEPKALELIAGALRRRRPPDAHAAAHLHRGAHPGRRALGHAAPRGRRRASLVAVYHVPAGAHPDFAAIDVLAEHARRHAVRPALQGPGRDQEGRLAPMPTTCSLQDPGVLVFGAQIRDGQSVDAARERAPRRRWRTSGRTPFTDGGGRTRAKTSLLKQMRADRCNDSRALGHASCPSGRQRRLAAASSCTATASRP